MEPETETLPPTEPAPIPVITLEDLLVSQGALQVKEQTDKRNLLTISNPDMSDIRSKLLVWASKGFPETYPILSFGLVAPDHCSDGVARSLNDYIPFCSGKSLNEHIAVLQGYLVGIQVLFLYSNGLLSIVVSRGR